MRCLAALFGMVMLSACGLVSERDRQPGSGVEQSSIRGPVPKAEPRSRYGNPRSYVVNGKQYFTLSSARGFVQRGIASWYGTKFHGRRTSSGETYDMYKMTAAHKTLPLPTYVSVRNLATGGEIVVRVNDRGPFHGDRIIDLSYAAATKLGIARLGTGRVEVRALEPGTPAGSVRGRQAPRSATLRTGQALHPGRRVPGVGECDQVADPTRGGIEAAGASTAGDIEWSGHVSRVAWARVERGGGDPSLRRARRARYRRPANRRRVVVPPRAHRISRRGWRYNRGAVEHVLHLIPLTGGFSPCFVDSPRSSF